MAMAGLWMADGLALLVAPLWIVGQVRQALSTSPSLAKWSGLTLVGGMILLLQASDLIYPAVWEPLIYCDSGMEGKASRSETRGLSER